MLFLVVVIALALVFDLTNGFHDAANAVAAPVATEAMRPGPAVLVVGSAQIAGALLVGTAVADTVGGVVALPRHLVVASVGAALTSAILWNLATWWWALPSSSSHALVGGLVGACTMTSGVAAVHWGGWHDGRASGVFGVLLGLAVSPVVGAVVGGVCGRLARTGLRSARRRVEGAFRVGEWGTAAALGFAHGTNDAQKTMGVMTLLLVSEGHLAEFRVPVWVKVAAALSLVLGTAVGGGRVVRTLGRGIYRMRPLDGLVSQGGSAGVILAAASAGAPVSTTHVVAASVVGVGAEHRRHRVRWAVVQEMGSAWLVTMPVTAVLAAGLTPVWGLFA
ncbi:PiT family inorganic phosphate transporter [Saccharopolyspora gloriosae]|uniref:PiT family inorganic phosphate transporter n=1 Tax=Saccharopolyspora gloriosae TaxID=455344 RepID=A0A840NI76_9PSEU|nr:PiT family inorganic phosphate transporter [Saccharopolyspora gloriosae]